MAARAAAALTAAHSTGSAPIAVSPSVAKKTLHSLNAKTMHLVCQYLTGEGKRTHIPFDVSHKDKPKKINRLSLVSKGIHALVENERKASAKEGLFMEAFCGCLKLPTAIKDGIVEALGRKDLHISQAMLEGAFSRALVNQHDTIVNKMLANGVLEKASIEGLENALVAACYVGHHDTFTLVIGHKDFADISSEELGYAFINTARRGYVELLQAIMRHARFEEISEEDLGKAFNNAAENLDIACLRAMMVGARFDEISVEYLGLAIDHISLTLSIHPHRNPELVDVLHFLINNDSYLWIIGPHMSHTLRYAAQVGDLSILTRMMSVSGFHDMDSYELDGSLTIACQWGHLSMVQAMMGSHVFDSCTLAPPFYESAKSGHHEIVSYLMSLARFAGVSRSDFVRGMGVGTINGHLPVVNTIMAHGRFGEITARELAMSYKRAFEGGHRAVADRLWPHLDPWYKMLLNLRLF